jgi:predicted Ser/Thr protein kinase
MTSAAPSIHHSDTSTTRLTGVWVWIARGVWLLLLLPLLIGQVMNFGLYYEKLTHLEPVGLFQEGWTQETLRAAVTAAGISPFAIAALVVAQTSVSMIIFCGVGLLIYWRRSDEWIGLLTSFILVGLGLATGPDISNVPEILAWPIQLVGTLVWPTLFILPAIFPDGRFVPGWMRYFPLAIYGLFAVILLFFQGSQQTPPAPILVLVFSMAALSIGSGVYRYLRRSGPLEKQQTKWFLFGMVVWLSTSLINVAMLAIFQFSGPALVIFELVNQLLSISFALIPFGLAFGLLRYRLWDIDFVINRSLVLGVMALLFVLFAAGSLFVISQIAADMTGGPLVGVAIGAAIFGIAYNPVLNECRTFVDKYIYGIKLDYIEAVKAYGTKREAVKMGDTKSSFGAYTGMTLLGRGGMGEVYRAGHPTLKRAVAIKILPDHSSKNDEAYKRFMREAQTIAGLKHPNIITLHDVGEQDGKPFMVMEYIDGKDLSEVIKERGRLPLAEALPILSDIASALDHAHAGGIIHRDIKPSNVMIEKITGTGKDKATRAVLMDFGIAKGYAVGTRLTQSGMIGTLDYISPEQIQGAAEVDARADIYSFGVMAYETLTGELPFKHTNPGAMVMAHLMQPPPDPREIVPDLPEDAALAVMRSMSKKPGERFSTAGEFIAAMRES